MCGMKACVVRVWNEEMRAARVEFYECVVRVWNEEMRGAPVE